MPKIMYRPNPVPPPFPPPVPPTPDYPFPVAGSATLSPVSWQEGANVTCNISWDSQSLVDGWALYGFKNGQWEETNFMSDGSPRREFLFEDAPFDSSSYEKYCVVGLDVHPNVPSINLSFPVAN